MDHDCRYTPTIMDGPVVRFGVGRRLGRHKPIIGDERDEWSAEINASRNGVSLSGDWPIYTVKSDLDHIKQVIEWAWVAHADIHAARGTNAERDAAKKFVELHNATLEEIRAEAAKIPSPF